MHIFYLVHVSQLLSQCLMIMRKLHFCSIGIRSGVINKVQMCCGLDDDLSFSLFFKMDQAQIKIIFWDHFVSNFNSNDFCCFHFLHPCCNCAKLPHPCNYNSL